jgi:hypothetical protein
LSEVGREISFSGCCVFISTLLLFHLLVAQVRTINMGDDLQKRFELLRSVGEECVQESELRNLLEKKPGFRLYDGFEPSGRMHIAQGIFKVYPRPCIGQFTSLAYLYLHPIVLISSLSADNAR